MKQRFLMLVAGFFIALAIACPSPVLAKGNSKYAALVIDADTGRVLHENNADAIRYPASLTKMMTLYMTYDAIRSGKLTLNQKIPVSAKAASMPQTNIRLRKGDSITVEQAIIAVTVHSANDAAVVLAEAVGNNEWNFGVLMTNKARALGMRNTVFRNASGLPDSKQHTTARDMAVLGVALRRDFPQYYHYLNVRSFTYKGITFNSHNRVMKRYPGADGIKTGYINASGFNLVTSVQRNGYNLLGVVFGGTSAQRRDDQMISLLDDAMVTMAGGKFPTGKEKVQIAANIPTSLQPAAATAPTASAAIVPAPKTRPSQNAEAAKGAVAYNEYAVANDASSSAVPIPQPNPRRSEGMQFASLSQQMPPAGTHGAKQWGIQVGAYSEAKQALIAAANAMSLAQNELAASRMAVMDAGVAGAGIHRARLNNLTENEARTACRKLMVQKAACFVYHSTSVANAL